MLSWVRYVFLPRALLLCWPAGERRRLFRAETGGKWPGENLDAISAESNGACQHAHFNIHS